MDDDENTNKILRIKVILLGETGAGKSSIILRFVHNSFIPNHISTTLCSCTSKQLAFNNNKDLISFDIWDTAGQEKFRSIAKINYKDASVVILVYDITNAESYKSLKDYWYDSIKENSSENVIIALVGAKCDLIDDCKISEEEAKSYAESINAIYKLTSSLSNIGIDELFDEIGKKILSDENFAESINIGKGKKLEGDEIEEKNKEKNEKKNNKKNKEKTKNKQKKDKDKKCC